MADGEVHRRDAITLGAVIMGVSAVSSTIGLITSEMALYSALGALGGFLITPDADHHKLTVEEQLFGNIIKKVLGNTEVSKKLQFVANGTHKLFLAPYSIFIKHRSIWSHLPFLGTFLRIIYLYLVYSFFVGVESFDALILTFIDNIDKNTILMYFTWSLQDLLHAYKDDFKFIW